MEIDRFNIRVYGLFIREEREVLLADEERFGMQMTKFPGGGLHFGEGPADCLRREALEEFGQEISIGEHFYTTDFFQQAFFLEKQQLISIYYRASFVEDIRFRLATKPYDFKDTTGEIVSFRFAEIQSLELHHLSFPIDRHVLGLLRNRYPRA